MSIPTVPRRIAITGGGTLVLILSVANAAVAQEASRAGAWEFRLPSGAYIGTGDQRNHLKDAQVTAAQLSWLVRPRLAMTGTLGWARSRDLAAVGDPKLDIFTTDLGIEARSAEWIARGPVTFSAFVGLGAGMRSYNYRKLDVDATNNLAGYAAVGGEIGMGRVGLRLEARDYGTGFKPLLEAGRSEARNDVVIVGALRFNRRRASQQKK